MKNLIILSTIGLLSFSMVACNQTNKSTPGNGDRDSTAATATTAATPQSKTGGDPKTSVSVKEIVGIYLQLKNALSEDNSNAAATAGKALSDGFAKLNQSVLTPAQKKSYADIAGDANEHAEHIGANAGNIKHQREHFETLSQDIYDLVKAGGNAGYKLYFDHCPMYNDGKGADWLSDKKEIQNPYLGKSMPTCGVVKEELN
nr:DUF3347 domain-containing protein [uncultured Mucilaginibacter sp.]